MKQVFFIDEESVYIDTYILNEKNNTYYNGKQWCELTSKYVEVAPPVANKVKWNGEKWIILEPRSERDRYKVSTQQEKINATLLKQNAELKLELDEQRKLINELIQKRMIK